MAAFAYSAINAQGLELKGEIHAPDLAAAREQLRIRGLLARKLNELPASGDDGVRSVFKAVKPKSLQIFSRQFATMIDAGLNVVSALVILEEQTDDAYLAAVVQRAARRRRGRAAALAGDGAAPEGVQPPLRLDGRSRRGRRHPRHRPRPRRVPDREGDADQAPRQGRDDLPDDGVRLRDPRPHRDAALPRPRLREDLQATRRRASEAHADRRRRVASAAERWYIIFPAFIGSIVGFFRWKKSESGARSGTASSSRCR